MVNLTNKLVLFKKLKIPIWNRTSVRLELGIVLPVEKPQAAYLGKLVDMGCRRLWNVKVRVQSKNSLLHLNKTKKSRVQCTQVGPRSAITYMN